MHCKRIGTSTHNLSFTMSRDCYTGTGFTTSMIGLSSSKKSPGPVGFRIRSQVPSITHGSGAVDNHLLDIVKRHKAKWFGSNITVWLIWIWAVWDNDMGRHQSLWDHRHSSLCYLVLHSCSNHTVLLFGLLLHHLDHSYKHLDQHSQSPICWITGSSAPSSILLCCYLLLNLCKLFSAQSSQLGQYFLLDHRMFRWKFTRTIINCSVSS